MDLLFNPYTFQVAARLIKSTSFPDKCRFSTMESRRAGWGTGPSEDVNRRLQVILAGEPRFQGQDRTSGGKMFGRVAKTRLLIVTPGGWGAECPEPFLGTGS